MKQWWTRFLRWFNHENQPVYIQPSKVVQNPLRTRLERLEANVADLIGGRVARLERWAAGANASIAPVVRELEEKIKHWEERMATPAELQQDRQSFEQRLTQHLTRFDQAVTELQDVKTALEAQTDKYKTACQDRDAALQREQEALRERDEIRAELTKWDAMVQAAHSRAASKPVA